MKHTFNNMENYKINLVYWLANQFGYEITMVRMDNGQELKLTEETPVMSLKEKTKNFLVTKLHKKMGKKKKEVVQVDETPVLTLRDKLKEMGKL
jgi:uncharacterized protein YdaL